MRSKEKFGVHFKEDHLIRALNEAEPTVENGLQEKKVPLAEML